MTDHATEIAAASVEDAAAVAHIHVATWQAAYRGIFPAEYLAGLTVAPREAYWREAIAIGTPQVLVARRNAEVVGWIAFGAGRDPDATVQDAEVWALYVQPQAWATGAGKALWSQARARLVAAGFRSVSLWVLSENARAIGFYRKAGFTPDGTPAKDLVRGGRQAQEVRYSLHV